MAAEAEHYKSKHGLASYSDGLRQRSNSAPVLLAAEVLS
jgi:hypothetical protein